MKKKTQVILVSLLLIIILIAYIYFITIGWAILGTYLNSNNNDSEAYRASFADIDIVSSGENRNITVYCPVPIDSSGKTMDAVYNLVSNSSDNLSLINTEHGLMLKINLNGSVSLSASSKNVSQQVYLSSDNSDQSMEYGEGNSSCWVYLGENVSSSVIIHFRYEVYAPGIETIISTSVTISPDNEIGSWNEIEYNYIRLPPPTA